MNNSGEARSPDTVNKVCKTNFYTIALLFKITGGTLLSFLFIIIFYYPIFKNVYQYTHIPFQM